MKSGFGFTLSLLFSFLAAAQPPRTIQAVGNATVSAAPDQVKVDLGVTTIGTTAQDAANQNATAMTAVLAAVRQVLGPSADIRTIGYSITPNYKPNTSPPMLTGYTATNTVEVTSGDMNSIVKVIDGAGPAGATNITNLHFAIANDEPLREQALAAASKQAVAHAQAIAGGLGMKAGNILRADEGVTVSAVRTNLAPTATPTPIEPGQVQVSATVTIVAQLTQ